MATVSLTTSAGIASVATPRKLRTASCITKAGLYSSPYPVNWTSAKTALSRVPWIPKAGTPLSNDGGKTLNPVWDRCLRWLFEEALGGISAKTPAQLGTQVADTQAQVASTTNYVEQVAAFAAGVAAATTATAQVAVSNGLTGATSIPATPPTPSRPSLGL